MRMHTYLMTHVAANGKVTQFKAAIGSDADARLWGRTVVERDGGKVSIRLQDGTLFICP